MPTGLTELLAFDQVFLSPLSTRISDNGLQNFLEAGLKHSFWLSYVGPQSEEHVQIASHAVNLFKLSLGKFLTSSAEGHEVARRVSLAINGLLEWVSAPPDDINGAVRSFQVADKILSLELPWERLDCKDACQRVFFLAQLILSQTGYFDYCSGALVGAKLREDSKIESWKGLIRARYLSPGALEAEEASIPDAHRLTYLAENLYRKSINILQRRVGPDDLLFWKDFLSRTPTDSCHYTCGIQALCQIDKREFQVAVFDLMNSATEDIYSARNLVALRVMESARIWTPNVSFEAAVCLCVDYLSQTERSKIIKLVDAIPERFAAFFAEGFDGKVCSKSVKQAVEEIRQLLSRSD
jgi:hypothetical protein